jgi:hypothetical protein
MDVSATVPRYANTFTARGILQRLGHSRPAALPPATHRRPGGPGLSDGLRCQVQGCRSLAMRLAQSVDGKSVTMCGRCREELVALLGTMITAPVAHWPVGS